MKNYTDLGQSRALAEIMPIESADMRIGNYVGKSGKVDGTNIHYYLKGETFGAPQIIEAWSLAALLNVLPNGTDVVKEEADTENEKYMCTVGIKDNIISTFANNPVDACVEMIVKLNKLKLL